MAENEVCNILGMIKETAAGWDGVKAFIIMDGMVSRH